MSSTGLTSGEEFLRDAAKRFFEDLYENPGIFVNKELHRDLPWTPALRFVVNDHVNVFVEVSETGPYPQIVRMRHANVLQHPEPIAVYAVCPEEVFLKSDKRSEIKELQAHGCGLITVNSEEIARREFPAIPLIQVISSAEFKTLIQGLPQSIKRHVVQAYEDYNSKPVNGVAKITEIIEGLVEQACVDVYKKGILSKTALGNTIANKLDALHREDCFAAARAAIGGVRSHYSTCRNRTHHWPKNKKKAHEKYADCKYDFVEGIQNVKRFRESMKNIGLTGNVKK
jgi:hypothetical protein